MPKCWDDDYGNGLFSSEDGFPRVVFCMFVVYVENNLCEMLCGNNYIALTNNYCGPQFIAISHCIAITMYAMASRSCGVRQHQPTLSHVPVVRRKMCRVVVVRAAKGIYMMHTTHIASRCTQHVLSAPPWFDCGHTSMGVHLY